MVRIPKIENPKQTICLYFIQTASQSSPQEALQLFRRIFIEFTEHSSSMELSFSVINLLLSQNEADFQYTLKRVCFILVHEWWHQKETRFIKKLIQQFDDPLLQRPSISKAMQRLRKWTENFKASPSFQELKLYAKASHKGQFWQERYKAYLLTEQYENDENPLEQRQLSRLIAYDLKMAFRYELVTFKSHHRFNKAGTLTPSNPTILNDTALLIIIKKILIHRKHHLPKNFKSKFFKTLKNKNFRSFKLTLNHYLLRSLRCAPSKKLFDHSPMATLFKAEASHKLLRLYKKYDDDSIYESLTVHYCKQVVKLLTCGQEQTPTPLFSMFLWGNSPLELALLLQIIASLCPEVKNHIDECIATLVRYGTDLPKKEQQTLIKFLEVFKVVFAIHGDYDHANIVKMAQKAKKQTKAINLDAYRVFAQWRNRQMTAAATPPALASTPQSPIKAATH